MKAESVFTKAPWLVAGAVAAVLILSGLPRHLHGEQRTTAPAAVPSHQVFACYFHRTQRCPTCMKISAYIEESLAKGFAAELRDGRVVWSMIDFQDPKNKRYTEFFQISRPTLVVVDVRNGKLAGWKPLPKVWGLVGKKEAFFKYVQDEVHKYRDERYGYKYKEVR